MKKRFPFSTRHLAYELIGVILIIASFTLALHHIATTEWIDFVFGNSDTLTLPLIFQSLHLHEPFAWVFSSQIFFFPEIVFYAFCSLFSSNYKAVLIYNAFLNIAVFYTLLRLLMRVVSKNKVVNIFFATLFASAISLLITTEHRAGGNIAMYFFVTTAYYGVILASIASLVVLAYLIKQAHQIPRKHLYIYIGILFLISLFTGTSNPLFFLQFSAPLLVTLLVLLLCRQIRKRLFLWIILSILVSIILSLIIRKTLLASYFSPLGTITSYLHFEKIIPTIKALKGLGVGMLHGDLRQKIEVTLLSLSVFTSITALVVATYSELKHSSGRLLNIKDYEFALIAFSCIASLATIAGAILTGNPLMRYLLPILFLPPLAVIPFLRFIPKINKNILVSFLALITVGVLGIAIKTNSLNAYSNLVQYSPAAASCLDQKLAGTDYHAGVAQYWRARVLQLNSRDGHIIEQTDGTLKRFGWLYNNAAYDMYNLSFVVVDKPAKNKSQEISNDTTFVIQPSSVLYALGQPSDIYQCSDFDIYGYQKGSSGYTILNRTVRDRSMGI